MVFHPPVTIISKVGDAGKGKCALPAWNMLLRGFMAGAYIAMGASLATVCATGVSATLGAGIAKLVLGAVFPVGLIIIVLTGAELFTGDAMFAPMAAFKHKVSWAAVLNLWIWVYIGNLIGSIVFAYFMSVGPLISISATTGTATATAFGVNAVAIAAGKTSYIGGFAMWSAFIKAICCNWLVNLAILLGICADDAIGKIVGIWFPIMAFVSTGFEHCVANMYFIPAGILTQPYLTAEQAAGIGANLANLSWVTMWTNNIIVVTIGNIVGGMVFVGALYWISFKKEIMAD